MTALITGASSGIGYELAYIFAQQKINLVLVARSFSKLEQLSNDLKSKYSINVEILGKDLCIYESAEEIYSFTKSKGLKINYLVNNAGFGDFGDFINSTWKKNNEMIQLNITSLTHLTYLYLQDMKNNNDGKILNVASTAAFQPGPLMAVYYATKAYVLHFSEAIAEELKNKNISVTALCPGATESGFQKLAAMEESKLVKGKKLPTSKEVAEYGYNAMMKGKVVAIHGTANYFLANSIRFTPRWLVLKVVRWMQAKNN